MATWAAAISIDRMNRILVLIGHLHCNFSPVLPSKPSDLCIESCSATTARCIEMRADENPQTI